jgi:hypothetical protein
MKRALRPFILPGIWKAGASFQKVTEACLYWFELMSIVLLWISQSTKIQQFKQLIVSETLTIVFLLW